jgi:hypothetical protein
VSPKRLIRWIPFLMLPLLAACSDQRASYEINGSAHTLSLIRITSWPWDKTAKYSVVAARMPDCMRRHAMSEAPLNAGVEVFAPGNNAWILRQNGRMFVVETRTCEGFAPLDKVPDEGLGPLLGVFEMRGEMLVFTPAPGSAAPATN